MLENEIYNKIRILQNLSKLLWFIQKCAKVDAKEADHTKCLKEYEELEKDLNKHVDQLYDSLKECMK